MLYAALYLPKMAQKQEEKRAIKNRKQNDPPARFKWLARFLMHVPFGKRKPMRGNCQIELNEPKREKNTHSKAKKKTKITSFDLGQFTSSSRR